MAISLHYLSLQIITRQAVEMQLEGRQASYRLKKFAVISNMLSILSLVHPLNLSPHPLNLFNSALTYFTGLHQRKAATESKFLRQV